MKTLFKRLTMPTPKFWATLRNYMALATTLFMGVIAIGGMGYMG